MNINIYYYTEEAHLMTKYILSLDAGTTSSRSIIFDNKARIIEESQVEFSQIYLKPGWVEHDPNEILKTQIDTIHDVIKKAKIKLSDIDSIGITNQRETVVIWDKNTGKPVYNAIVWQCRRTTEVCEKLKRDKKFAAYVTDKTGLIIDAYFSASKVAWILDNVDGLRKKAEKGELLFGTIDTWLIWNLTDGAVHATDYSNASRTMLFDIKKLIWDDKILKKLNIPKAMLPKVKPSSYIFGYTSKNTFGAKIPISGAAGDQQAALFGHVCFEKGDAKNTYGTGCFILMNTGEKPIRSKNKLLTTIAYGVDEKIVYALEGSIFNAGSAIQWLRDEIGLIKKASDSGELAACVPDTGGVYLVPAFTGLGAPYWDMRARGAILGMTRGTNKNHIVRAVLESIAYQTKDVFSAMEKDSLINLKDLEADGGASASEFLMQFQADILDVKIKLPRVKEATALGAAYLAGLATGFFKSLEEIKKLHSIEKIYKPKMDKNNRKKLYYEWQKAVSKARDWQE
jgi:glycerol kinase